MRPQTFLSTLTQAIKSGNAVDWSTLFIAAPALKGDHTKALGPIRSLAEHDALLGGRASYSELRDQLEAFFAAGGKRAYVARVTHNPVKATVNVQDAVPATLVTVTAKNVGEYGSDFDMVTSSVSGSGASSTATWSLKDAGGNTIEELVGATAAQAAAHEWADVVVTQGVGTGTIVAATYSLDSGADGHASAVAADVTAVLPLFTRELGTGVVVAPMLDVTAAGAILEAHAAAYNRVWLSHSADTPTASTIAAQGTAARAANLAKGGIIAGKVRIGALAENPTVLRTIAPEGAVAGNIAKIDEQGSPARAAAGIKNGVLAGVVEPTQTFSDADLDTLHNAGVNVIRVVRGELCLYDFITPATQSGAGSEWLNLGQVRAHAAILAELDKVAELYQFSLLDGSKTLADFHASITAVLMGFHAGGTLYGNTPSEAFTVDVNGVNNADTIAAHELHASVGVKYAETNYWTYIDVTKVPVNGTL